MKNRIPILLACLAMLSMASVCMVLQVYAGYVTSTQGSDEARVADFEVAVTPADRTDQMTINDSDAVASYAFTVENRSEVAVECRIRVTLTDAADQTEQRDLQEAVQLTLSMEDQVIDLHPATDSAGDIIPGQYISDVVDFTYAHAEQNDTKTFTLTLERKEGATIGDTQHLMMAVDAEMTQKEGT